MGVPSWLLKIVIGFLTDRKMLVKYKDVKSGVKDLPGGGPQGTLLGLLLFIVLINDVGFDGQLNNAGEIVTSKRNMKVVNEIHLKYVDDLTLAEAINLPTKLEYIPDSVRQQPDNYHARTGHVLPVERSLVHRQLEKTREYAVNNDMMINYKKTKAMVFNPCTSVDFMPDLRMEEHELEVVDEVRLLGIIISSDLKWSANTENMIKRAYKKLWIIRRLKGLGASEIDLVELYTKMIRSILELAVPAWQGAITQQERINLERVQKSAAHIILGDNYFSYKMALKHLNLESLESRRNKLCLNFSKKAVKHNKFKNWFKLTNSKFDKRKEKYKDKDTYLNVNAKHSRLAKSPLGFLTRMLNEYFRNKA